jgi:hypothetical protein
MSRLQIDAEGIHASSLEALVHCPLVKTEDRANVINDGDNDEK